MYWRIISLPLYNVFGCSSKRDPECFFFFFFENGLYIVCLQAAGMIYIYIYIYSTMHTSLGPPNNNNRTWFLFLVSFKEEKKRSWKRNKKKKKGGGIGIYTRRWVLLSISVSNSMGCIGKDDDVCSKKKNISLEEILTKSLSQAYE